MFNCPQSITTCSKEEEEFSSLLSLDPQKPHVVLTRIPHPSAHAKKSRIMCIYAYNHRKTHQTSPLTPWDPPEVPFDPLVALGDTAYFKKMNIFFE